MAQNNEVYAQRAEADAQARGAKLELEHYRKLSQLKGEQQAAMAANGVDLTFGSPLDVAADTAVLGQEDAQTIRENTVREAQGFAIDASNYRADAAAHHGAAIGEVIGGGLNLGSTILGGLSSASGAAAKYGAPSWMSKFSVPKDAWSF